MVAACLGRKKGYSDLVAPRIPTVTGIKHTVFREMGRFSGSIVRGDSNTVANVFPVKIKIDQMVKKIQTDRIFFREKRNEI